MGENATSVSDRVRRYPQAWLVAFCVTLFMTALYESSPIAALQGAGLLIGTTWYYATDNDREGER